MHAKGSVTIGGVAFGAVTVDMETDDGTKYHFAGYYADAGVGVAKGDDFEGDFPGLSHIIGGCMLEVAQGGLGPGGAVVNFHDLHGEIGSLGGYCTGAVVQFGFGGGSWEYEDTANKALVEGREPTGIAADYAESAE